MAKVVKGHSPLEDQGLKLQVLDNVSRSQVKVFLDNLSQLLGRIYTRAKVEYSNAVWLRQTRDFATQQAAYVTDL